MSEIKLFGKKFVETVHISHSFRLENPMNEDACFIYIQQGTQEIYSPTQKMVLQDNEAILMKCGYYIANIKDASETNEFQSIVFHLDPELIQKAFKNRNTDFLQENKQSKDLFSVKIKTGDLIKSFIKSIQYYFDHPDEISDELLALKLQELVLILSDNGNNTVSSHLIGTLYNPVDIAFENIITANLYNNLSIGELAFLTNRSESTFKRDFRKIYATAPAKYIKQKKLDKAAGMLKNSGLSIKAISWECGFKNLAHFSSSFHSQYGKSPRSFKIDPIT